MKDFIFFVLYLLVLLNAGLQVIYIPILASVTGNAFYLLAVPVNLTIALIIVYLIESERECPFF